MSGVQSESQSSQVQQQEEEYAQPRANRRPRRRNNLLNKIFKCLCGKKYSSVAAWYTHFKKHDNDTEDRRRQIKQAFDELCDRIFERPDPNDPQITIQDIPTFHEEASHKESSDLAFASICTEWRSRPAQTYGRMDDNIFDRRKYRVQGDIFSFEDLITRRREALAQDVQDLLSEHSLEELYRLAGSRDEFRDYKLIKEPFVGRQTLNFGWDLVKYFKPTFAAKLQVFLYALCCEDQLDLDNWQEWKDFSAAHSNILSFIMPILKQYHDQWLTRNQNFFDYQ